MKVVILAGGFGTRISEYSGTIPKPMIKIGEKPILWHIMKIYSKFGFKDFYVALGHKGEIIKEYFSKNYFDWNIISQQKSNVYNGCRVGACRMNSSVNMSEQHITSFCLNKLCV